MYTIQIILLVRLYYILKIELNILSFLLDNMEVPITKDMDSKKRRGTLIGDDSFNTDTFTGRIQFTNLEELRNISKRYINDLSNNGDTRSFTCPKPINYIPGMDSSLSGSELDSWDCRSSYTTTKNKFPIRSLITRRIYS